MTEVLLVNKKLVIMSGERNTIFLKEHIYILGVIPELSLQLGVQVSSVACSSLLSALVDNTSYGHSSNRMIWPW